MDVTATTTEFYKKVAKLLKSKGYKYKRSIASAEEDLTWIRNPDDAISISGWHGKRGWGPERVAMAVYAGPEYYPKVVLDIFELDEANVHPRTMRMNPEMYDQYQQNLDKAYSKVEELASGLDESNEHAVTDPIKKAYSLYARGESVGRIAKQLKISTKDVILGINRLDRERRAADATIGEGAATCETCGGQGEVYWDHQDEETGDHVPANAPCPDCSVQEAREYEPEDRFKCKRCNGTGKRNDRPCQQCDGTGEIFESVEQKADPAVLEWMERFKSLDA